MVKYEEQQVLINKLQADNDELRSYDFIGEMLDEIQQNERKYDDNTEDVEDDVDDIVEKPYQFWQFQ